MSMRIWAVKPGELKALSRSDLLIFSVRCARRAEPWRPAAVAALWDQCLAHVLSSLRETSTTSKELAQRLMDTNTAVAERMRAPDPLLARCMNHAGVALGIAVRACELTPGPALTKAAIEAAKMACSIPAVLAHGGRVAVANGENPVEVAATTIWNATRADVAAIAPLSATPTTVGEVRDLAPLWPGGPPPDWVPATIDTWMARPPAG